MKKTTIVIITVLILLVLGFTQPLMIFWPLFLAGIIFLFVKYKLYKKIKGRHIFAYIGAALLFNTGLFFGLQVSTIIGTALVITSFGITILTTIYLLK